MDLMFTRNWREIWAKRNFQNESSITLIQKLIWMNGFDSPLGSMYESDWRAFVEKISKRIKIKENSSIFEIGCGSGAFLFPFYEKGLQIGGIDFSVKQIDIAKEVFNSNNFTVCDANSLNHKKKYDFILSNHVIHYFESMQYTTQVLKLLFKKVKKSIYLSGIPDINYKKEQERFRQNTLSEQEYQNKYKGLDILYFDKKYFDDMAKTHNFSIEFYEHEMPGFTQGKFRFDCHLKKLNSKKP